MNKRHRCDLKIIVLLLTFVMLCLVGCKTVESTSTEEVTVTIYDVKYSKGSSNVPPSHITYVMYDNWIYPVSGHKIYHAYESRIGEEVTATLKTWVFKNGETHQRFVKIEDIEELE